MKQLLILVLLLSACAKTHKPKPLSSIELGEPNLKSFIMKHPDIDTAYVWQRTGCFNEFYKQVNDTFVLKVKFNEPPKSSERIEVVGNNEVVEIELWVFEKGQAHMHNICSDVIVVYATKPIKQLKAIRATIDFIYERAYHVNLLDQDSSYFFILSNAVFVDGKEEIRLGRQLFWDVPNYYQLG
jgi:hypothetical protein